MSNSIIAMAFLVYSDMDGGISEALSSIQPKQDKQLTSTNGSSLLSQGLGSVIHLSISRLFLVYQPDTARSINHLTLATRHHAIKCNGQTILGSWLGSKSTHNQQGYRVTTITVRMKDNDWIKDMLVEPLNCVLLTEIRQYYSAEMQWLMSFVQKTLADKIDF